MLEQVVQAVRGAEYVTPKTILGFLGSITAIGAGLAVGLAFALSGTESLHYIIIGVVIFVLLLICVVVGVVIYFAAKDPSKLQLGQVSAKDYIAIQKMGDDTFGEYLELPGSTSKRASEQSAGLPQLDTPDEGNSS